MIMSYQRRLKMMATPLLIALGLGLVLAGCAADSGGSASYSVTLPEAPQLPTDIYTF
jgi:ABC-type glycerol-3-phosphate transport system substrate-binding protein